MTKIKNNLTSIILFIVLIGIFVGTIFLFKNVNNNIDQVKAEIEKNETYSVFFPTATNFSDALEETLSNEKGSVISSVKAYKDENQIGIIYLVKVDGYKPDFELLVGIDSVNKKVTGYKAVKYEETFLDKLGPAFNNQFNNTDISNPGLSYNTNAGVTSSSTAIINAVMLAREAYYISIGEEVPMVKAVLKEMKSSLNNALTFDCVVEKEGTNYNVVISYENYKFAVVSGAEALSNAEIEFILKQAKTMRPNTYIGSISDNNVVIMTKGYTGDFEVIFTISEGKIIDIKVGEFYHESFEYNQGYNPSNGDPADVIPDGLLKNEEFDNINVAGATVTSNAIKNAYLLALEYLNIVEVE